MTGIYVPVPDVLISILEPEDVATIVFVVLYLLSTIYTLLSLKNTPFSVNSTVLSENSVPSNDKLGADKVTLEITDATDL